MKKIVCTQLCRFITKASGIWLITLFLFFNSYAQIETGFEKYIYIKAFLVQPGKKCDLFDSKKYLTFLYDSSSALSQPISRVFYIREGDTMNFERSSNGVYFAKVYGKKDRLFITVNNKLILIPTSITEWMSTFTELNIYLEDTSSNVKNNKIISSYLYQNYDVKRPRANFVNKKKKLRPLRNCEELKRISSIQIIELNNYFLHLIDLNGKKIFTTDNEKFDFLFPALLSLPKR